MLKLKGQVCFENKWPCMRPIVQKLLRQDPVSPTEWQQLFYDVHLVCLWDEKGALMVRHYLQDDIVDFIKQAQKRVLAHHQEEALLKSYIHEWRKFFTQCNYLPTPFRQLESALMGKPNTPATLHGAINSLCSTLTTNYNNNNNNSSNRCASRRGSGACGGGGVATVDSFVRKLMLDSWNESIFNDIKHHLQDSAMRLVQAERNGEAFDTQLVIGVRESYVNLCSNVTDRLQIYRENFEAAYIESTEMFYRLKAPEYLTEHGVQAYMRYADAKLREEEMRANRYLEPCANSLIQTCVSVLVENALPTLLAECGPLIRTGDVCKLQLMFRLLERINNGVEPMLHELETYIVQEGLSDMIVVADIVTQDSEKYVEQLVSLYQKFSQLVRDAFSDDCRFLTARDKAFRLVVNDTTVFRLDLNHGRMCGGHSTSKTVPPESKCPELLANYCDMLLRKSPLSKRLSSEEIDSKLKEVLLVLKYVTNKDVFMRYHKAHLTRRLLLDISADSEKEEDMVEWLRKVGMPADYVNKLARMFQDIKVSNDLNGQFKNCSIARHDAINIKILNAGAWARGSERVSVSLPVELEDYIPDIEEFYKKKHSGRKLQWHHHMSNGTISFITDSGKFDLDVTTFQMAVLFVWNQRPYDRISYENLRLATELPDSELRRTLWSLIAFPKLKRQLLLVSPIVVAPKDITDHTLFWINHDFALIKNAKLQKRGKVNLVGRLQLGTERSQVEDNESIIQLRILRTQEAIIKILKMRKRITNSLLQTELVDILKNLFLPSKKMIKEQLEWLIENKYMRRDDDDINTFIYVA